MDTITGQNDNGGVFDAVENSNNYRFAVNASWAVNWFLLGMLTFHLLLILQHNVTYISIYTTIGAKLFAAIVSSSKAVTAAMVDSVVDILSQAILSLSDSYIARYIHCKYTYFSLCYCILICYIFK